MKITPNAKRSEIISYENQILKVKIAAPPVDGKANKALVAFLAEEWNVSKSQIQIVHGETSKSKILEVPDKVLQILVTPPTSP